ncbi:hypothetical protein KVV02_004732 [Mortierella alpina]|uniref:Uncharacterized protein n=1 Tax=Mortierella alpina TaxID=64518 RepID=A0A9P8D1J9_MORAP|nr:hypothetical protein KVV02_004732 [Mortierella alpina]
MCHRVVCKNCGKFTWEGCGLHIAQALAGLSREQICSCDDGRGSEHAWSAYSSASSSNSGSNYTPVYPLAGHSSSAEYKRSKISSASTAETVVKKERQAASSEGLKRSRQEIEQELKEANQDALQRLLKGLSQASDIE